MKTKVVITIDTEPDNMWDIGARRRPQFKNISELDKLQRVFDKFCARPTYLTSFSVSNSSAISILKDISKSVPCEIGSHLHAPEIPPFEYPERGDGSYLHQYAPEVQLQKFMNLRNLITDVFGYKPVSYRGGRWSFDRDAMRMLSENEYLVDTSVTPGISWENDGGSNFKKYPYRDYFFEADENSSGVLEVPVSVKIKSGFSQISKFIYLNLPNYLHVEGILRRLAGFDIIWLDPSFNSYEEMKWLSDDLLEEGVSHLNIMFHSSVIIAGGSPYTADEKDTERFFERLEKLLSYLLRDRKLESLTLKEFYDYRKGKSG